MERLRIAQVAPPLERVPPRRYGGTERVMFALIGELVRRGHEVTTFASADSEMPGRHVPTVPEALRPSGFDGDALPYFVGTSLEVIRRSREFDLVHSHLEWMSLLLARSLNVPLVSTFHGRLDLPWIRPLLVDPPRGLVAISRSQASVHPDVPWEAIVHNGLDLGPAPFERRRGDDLCFVGRVSPEKGIVDAIEIARLSGRRLRIAAKIGTTPPDRSYWQDVVKPALERADIEFLGEIPPDERDQLFASSYATLMPGAWPEPFGLVAIESLACGTPLLARRAGALPEIVREGVDGFLGDDAIQLAFHVDQIASLDRMAIRTSVIERFSAGRMADRYEAVYQRMLAAPSGGGETIGQPPVLATRPRRPDLPARASYPPGFTPLVGARQRPGASLEATAEEGGAERRSIPVEAAADDRDDARAPTDREPARPPEREAGRIVERDAARPAERDAVALPTARRMDRPAGD